MPPASTFNNLSNARIVVTRSNIEFEIVASLLWLNVTVFLVENFVKFLHELYVDQTVELRLL